METKLAAARYGVAWFSTQGRVAQTAFQFTADEARRVATDGATAPDFWEWAAAQSFGIDGCEGESGAIVCADAETETEQDEFIAWEGA